MDNKTSYLEPCLEKQLKGHKNSITALYFSPNGHQIASSSLDNSVLLWDLRGTMRSYRFQGHSEAVMDVTFSPSGKYMASASRDKTVRLWVPTVTGSTGTFKAHSQTVRSVQFSSDGSKIITASDDKIVKLWSTEKHKFISSYVGHTNWVRCARMSHDGCIIASCSDDKTTRLWNVDSGECIHTFKDQKGHGLQLAWHPSGCYIAVASSQGNVKLYDIRTHNLVQYYSIHNEAVTQVAIHPSGSYILTASKDGKMKILDLLEGHPIFTLSGHSGAVNTVNFSTTGDSFASAGEDKLVFIWKTNFTELSSESKENIIQNNKLTSATRNNKQDLHEIATKYEVEFEKIEFQQNCGLSSIKHGTRDWYLCHHSMKYPVTTFVHSDNLPEVYPEVIISSFNEPNANSTMLEHGEESYGNRKLNKSVPENFAPNLDTQNVNVQSEVDEDNLTFSVGHISHIPRTPPTAATHTVPSLINMSVEIEHEEHKNVFGLIKLRDSDVCYTSGTIEWVGRKRSFPLNTGFKLINESYVNSTEPLMKKTKRNFESFHSEVNKMKECDCADVLPTVHAIVDHLNALHEAVDIIDLRLNSIEGFVGNK